MPFDQKLIGVDFAKLKDAPGSAFELAAKYTPAESEDEAELTKVELLARTAEPLSHWWWGNIVHDMAGFFRHKDTVTLDWNHNPDELVGYADQQVADAETGLTLRGKLVSLEPKDQADKIVKWRKSGIPLEASIYFDEAELEYIPEEAYTEVNGRKFSGPGVVVRKWTIRGCAICPYGYDGKTETRLSKSKFNFSIKEGQKMPTEVKPEETKPADVKTELAKPAEVVTPVQTQFTIDQYRQELNKFTTAFGAENGAKWFGEGVSFGDAQTKQIGMLSKEIETLKTDNTKLKDDLAKFRKTLGEDKGLETSPSDSSKKLASNMTEARKLAAETKK